MSRQHGDEINRSGKRIVFENGVAADEKCNGKEQDADRPRSPIVVFIAVLFHMLVIISRLQFGS